MTLHKRSSLLLYLNLHISLFYIISSLISVSSHFSSSSFQKFYSTHCFSFPKPSPQSVTLSAASLPPYIQPHSGFYITTKPGFRTTVELSDTLFFAFSSVNETHVKGLFSVEASLTLSTLASTHLSPHERAIFAVFGLKGFWSVSHGRLCAVDSGSYSITKSFRIPVVLKLYNLYKSTDLNSLIVGSLESLVSPDQIDHLNHFDHISLMLFPRINYEYSSNLKRLFELRNNEIRVNSTLDYVIDSLTSILFSQPLSLRYSRGCRGTIFGDIVNLELIESAEQVQAWRILMRFSTNTSEISSYGTLDPKETLVGEMAWDSQNNNLFVMACRFVNATGSWADARVSDCSTRLSLKFAEVWTIGNNSVITGRLWSTKDVEDSGYFEEIGLEISEDRPIGNPLVKYEYTKLDKAKELCRAREPLEHNTGKSFPLAFSNDMSFDVFDKKIGRGYAQPVSVGNALYSMRRERERVESYDTNPTEISYLIRLFNVSQFDRFDIFGEGIYDDSKGQLCMIGCRKIVTNNSNSSFYNDDFDCDILVNFQFPPKDAKLSEGFINGSIESTRKQSDPLHFNPFEFSSSSYVSSKVKDTIQMDDLEISLSLISNTLTCVFSAIQILHLRKNPDFRPFVSLTMLFTQTLGYTIPVLLDMKATKNPLLQDSEGVESKGVSASILVLLQGWLINLTCSARLSHENQPFFHTSEKKALTLSLPLYIIGVFLSLFSALSKQNRILEASKSYSNFLSDTFLVPQIILNMLRDSKEKNLSGWFYIGTTLVRVLSHGFGLYKAQKSGLKWVSSLWDFIAPFGSLILAAIVYLQHKFGGRCIGFKGLQ